MEGYSLGPLIHLPLRMTQRAPSSKPTLASDHCSHLFGFWKVLLPALVTVGAAVVWEEQSQTPMWSRKGLHQPVSAERITEAASGLCRPCSVRMPLFPCLDRCTGFPHFNFALSWFVFNETIRMALSMPHLVTFLPQLDSPAKSFGWPLIVSDPALCSSCDY